MILDEIVAHKREEVAAAKAALTEAELREQIYRVPPPRDFRAALRADGISFICEVKRASPSRGVMLEDVDALQIAALYEQTGARAISVLTDNKYFQGSLQDLTTIRQHVRVPCLRKEFIIDPYQIVEARAAQADAILLIVRILDDAQLRDYLALAKELGMDALVETHTAAEIERALEARAHIIGINNRDLDTLQVDVQTTFDLKKAVPGGCVLVSESGIRTREQVKQLEDGGIDAVLIGESLLTSSDIQGTLRGLLGVNIG